MFVGKSHNHARPHERRCSHPVYYKSQERIDAEWVYLWRCNKCGTQVVPEPHSYVLDICDDCDDYMGLHYDYGDMDHGYCDVCRQGPSDDLHKAYDIYMSRILGDSKNG